MKHLILFLLFTSLAFTVYAQKTSYKWGKPTKEDIEIKVCPYDSAASVIVLDEAGSVEFGYGTGAVIIKKYVKLKILNEQGLDAAVIRLHMYSKDNFEKLTDIKAHTLNLGASGKITEEKVESRQFFEVDSQDDWKETRFTFPSVKPGSILEYSYTVRSQSFTFLEGWMFQNPYPTLHSAFEAKIEEGLNYKLVYQGKRLIDRYGNSGLTNAWELYYLPALKEEPYMWNYLDYADKVKFQLVGYKKIGDLGTMETVDLLNNWEKIARDVLESSAYIDYHNSNRLSKDILEAAAISDSLSQMKKAEALYNHILSIVKWNGDYSTYPDYPANKLLGYHKGNSADINLMLCAVMRQAGLDATPMLVSTRKHGVIFKDCALLSQFNSVITYLKIDGKEYFVDATEKNRPMQLPPSQLLNTSGFFLDKKAPFWVEINAQRKSKSNSIINLIVGNEDTTRFSIDFKFDDYFALKYRNQLDEGTKNEVVRQIMGKPNSAASIDKIEILNRDSCSFPLQIHIEGTTTNLVNSAGKLLYFKPLIIPRMYKNPFSATERLYPVNFDFAEISSCTLLIKFADDLSLDNIPQLANLTIPDEMVSFKYSASGMGKKLSVTTRFTIENCIVPAKYYPNLKTMYGRTMEKLNEPIVFRIKQ